MPDQAPRIVFAGTPEFSVPALARLVATGRTPLAVLTQPDRPAVRGRQAAQSPVKSAAVSHQIPVLQPESLKNEATISTLRDLAPDLLVVVAYGLILPPAVLDLPGQGCWNIHASLLPRWRGAAPVQRAIEAGDTETGVCIMRMEAGLDTGLVYHRLTTPITAEDTGGSLHDRLADLGADALERCMLWLEEGRLPEPVAQDHAQAVYAPKVSKAEAELDWRRPAVELERQVRAFDPWPVCWFMNQGKRLRVWRATALETLGEGQPGQIINAEPAGIDVATGDGVLRLLEVQGEGARRMSAREYLNARSVT